ncbi:septum formation protein [Breoghania corrubedonensis]|uniref:7-methyl-GTP pyrophosphatase n=1 Tax=Breoghania corrubedonensis TaxID=665038 RepID=A0A2T5VHM4_9HYPH|nr:Maf-like protein [Breoghania corrubedonensis]PTW63259.1 septum formation protein [Breoghania corrubedonensis]
MSEIVLASASPWRAQMLRDAGLEIQAEAADIDERAVDEPLRKANLAPEDIALVLAEAKAGDVSNRHPGALVIGSDQVLDFDGEVFVKPETIEQARANLLALRGRSHQLHSAVVCVRDGIAIWRHVASATLTMRNFSPEFLGHYLTWIGDVALKSVGSYQIEGEGIQLFEAIEGDHFTIVGLPLLPLLGFLRDEGEIET